MDFLPVRARLDWYRLEPLRPCRVLRRRAPVIDGSVVAGGRELTASGSVVDEELQEKGLYQTICYSVSFLSIQHALRRYGTKRKF